MNYINCKQYAQEILDEVKAIPKKKTLAIITVGDNPASESYVKGKKKDCDYCGIPYKHIKFEDGVHQDYIIGEILGLNYDDSVGGIIVQLPLPAGYDEDRIVNAVDDEKDVDGFKPHSLFKPCTPEGIMHILHKELGDLSGRHAVVVGRGRLVGKPLAQMLLDEDCMVTVAHSKVDPLDIQCVETYADIVVSAVGKPNTTDLYVCRSADVVIDAGISKGDNGKLVGDCFGFIPGEFRDSFFDVDITGCSVTPVPGGVGLMTRAMLMKHIGEASVTV